MLQKFVKRHPSALSGAVLHGTEGGFKPVALRAVAAAVRSSEMPRKPGHKDVPPFLRESGLSN